MKAAVIEKPGKLTVKEVEKPEAGEYEAVCELLYGATCSGTDRHLINFDPPFSYWIKLPAILGHESVGRVTEVGSKVRNLKKGDILPRVGAPPQGDLNVAWGGFAEYGVAVDWKAMKEDGIEEEQWKEYMIHQPLPSDMDPREATMVTTWRETLSYIKRMGIGAGTSVAVIGSGGNGLSFAAHVKSLGGGPLVMIGSPNRKENALSAGTDLFLDYHNENAVNEALSACEEGFDFVIDAVGKISAADLGLKLLRPEGTFGSYGLDDIENFRLKPSLAPGTFTVNQNGYEEAETHSEVVELIQKDRLDASIWLDYEHTYELPNISEAFKAVEERECVKALIKLT